MCVLYHEDDGRCWSETIHLNIAQHFRHVTFARTHEEQPANDGRHTALL